MDDEKKQYSKISKEIRKKIIDKIHYQKESLLEVFLRSIRLLKNINYFHQHANRL